MSRIILDLCGGTGSWSAPYRAAGYDVRVVTMPDQDARLFKFIGGGVVHGILAAPPCTYFANSGARWKRSREQMIEALSVADACMRIAAVHGPAWWALENPVGSLRKWLGPPVMSFQPYQFGDPYTKRTLLWGRFHPPRKSPVPPTEGSKMHKMGPSPERQALRSVTPPGFAQAFFEANP